jgi:PIN domain nuclease of toxin-antitoxin system
VASSIYVIDTHPLVWYFEDSHRLSAAARQAFKDIEGGDAIGVVPTIVLAEIVHLADKKRIPLSINETIERLRKSSNFGITSLDLMVILLMVPLTSYEIHDRVIIATSRSFGASLITKDEYIRQSKIVPCIW